MDRLDIPEPSPGFLKARLESHGYTALGDSPVPWVLAALADPGLMTEIARDRPGDYARACRDAYEKRDFIRDLTPTGSPPAPYLYSQLGEAMKPQSWDAVLAEHEPSVVEAARAVQRLLEAGLPGAVVQFDPGNGLLAIGTSLKMNDLLFAIIPHRAHVNLQLADGVDLPNPDGLIEGTGKRIRHVKVRSAEAAGSPAIREIVRAQIAQRPRPAE